MRIRSLLALAAVGVSLAACSTVDRFDAAGDVHALLVAIRDNDRAGFDAHVDRQALKGQIEARLMDEARQRQPGDKWMAVAAVLAGPVADVAGEGSQPASIDGLLERLARDEFDLVGIGRALLQDPEWVVKIRDGRTDELLNYERSALATLY